MTAPISSTRTYSDGHTQLQRKLGNVVFILSGFYAQIKTRSFLTKGEGENKYWKTINSLSECLCISVYVCVLWEC